MFNLIELKKTIIKIQLIIQDFTANLLFQAKSIKGLLDSAIIIIVVKIVFITI